MQFIVITFCSNSPTCQIQVVVLTPESTRGVDVAEGEMKSLECVTSSSPDVTPEATLKRSLKVR